MFRCEKARLCTRPWLPLWRFAAAASVLVVCGSAGAQIERYKGLEPPDLLELRGHVGKRFPEEPLGWSLKLGDAFTPALYEFHLAQMRVLNSGRLPGSILSAVEPYTPNFRLFGSAEQMAALRGARPEQPVTITAYRRQGSRDLMLTGLEIGPASTPSPADL